MQQRLRGGGRRLHLRLHLRQRRHRHRPPQQGPDLRAVDAVQELRHFRRARPGDRHRHRPDEGERPHRPQRRGASELSL